MATLVPLAVGDDVYLPARVVDVAVLLATAKIARPAVGGEIEYGIVGLVGRLRLDQRHRTRLPEDRFARRQTALESSCPLVELELQRTRLPDIFTLAVGEADARHILSRAVHEHLGLRRIVLRIRIARHERRISRRYVLAGRGNLRLYRYVRVGYERPRLDAEHVRPPECDTHLDICRGLYRPCPGYVALWNDLLDGRSSLCERRNHNCGKTYVLLHKLVL